MLKAFSKLSKLTLLIVVLATAAAAGAVAARADNFTVGMGYPAKTYNDTELNCSYDSIRFNFPVYANPARQSYFQFRVDGWDVRSTTWYWFSGGQRWYWSGSWVGLGWANDSFELPGVHTVEAWEQRFSAAGAYLGWVYLGSCTTAGGAGFTSNWSWDDQSDYYRR